MKGSFCSRKDGVYRAPRTKLVTTEGGTTHRITVKEEEWSPFPRVSALLAARYERRADKDAGERRHVDRPR